MSVRTRWTGLQVTGGLAGGLVRSVEGRVPAVVEFAPRPDFDQKVVQLEPVPDGPARRGDPGRTALGAPPPSTEDWSVWSSGLSCRAPSASWCGDRLSRCAPCATRTPAPCRRPCRWGRRTRQALSWPGGKGFSPPPRARRNRTRSTPRTAPPSGRNGSSTSPVTRVRVRQPRRPAGAARRPRPDRDLVHTLALATGTSSRPWSARWRRCRAAARPSTATCATTARRATRADHHPRACPHLGPHRDLKTEHRPE